MNDEFSIDSCVRIPSVSLSITRRSRSSSRRMSSSSVGRTVRYLEAKSCSLPLRTGVLGPMVSVFIGAEDEADGGVCASGARF